MAYRLRLLGQLGRNVGQLVAQGRPRISHGNVRYFRILSRLDVDAQKVLMPALSPTMVEGTIVKWHKKEGEAIAAGDILCDIETDKAVVSMEVDEDAIVAKILKAENTKNIKIGSLIALMVAEGEDWKAIEVPADAADSGPVAAGVTPTPATQPPPSQAPSQPAVAGPPSDNAQKVLMPALSPTMNDGTIVKWHRKEGEAFASGDILCDVETDKAVVSFEMDDDGILAKIIKPEGSKGVNIGELIALTVAEGEDWQNVSVPGDAASYVSPASPSGGVSATPSTAQAPTHVSGSVPFGPAARNIMEVYRIMPTDVPPTGPGGRLTKGDLLQYIEQKGLKPAPVGQIVAAPSPAVAQTPPSGPSPTPGVALGAPKVPAGQAFVDIELTNMRKTIAQRLTEAKATIPHAYSVIDCNMGQVMHLRKSLKEEGVTVSVNDILIKAVAVTLQMVPEVNATWTGEGSRVLSNIDIATAVATEGGLITPIVKNAVGLGLQEISVVIRDLAEKARKGTLQPDEYQGGTFTITNLGMYGVHEFMAIVNPPSASILAVGGTHTELDSEGRPYPALTVTLCSDCRVVDDLLAARFLDTFRNVIEKPMLMLSQGAPIDLQALFAK